MTNNRLRIVIPREVLLIEIERHCLDTRCNARTRIGLTKEEARLYDGFECDVCERWNADGLTERDIPDWWEELTITGLDGLRARKLPGGAPETKEAGGGAAGAGGAGGVGGEADDGVVARLSEAWQTEGRRRGRDLSAKDTLPDDDDGGDV